MARIMVEIISRETGETSIIPVTDEDVVPASQLQDHFRLTGRYWLPQRRRTSNVLGFRTHSAHLRVR